MVHAVKVSALLTDAADIHPDPYYKTYSSTAGDNACHRGAGPAGVYGAETSDCDTPLTLVNATFKWIKDNIREEIDFIVWTGDSARHDNDEKIPRSDRQVVEQNQLMVERFQDVFGKPENYDDPDPTNDFIIPIVPTFGNNDILPHNIFTDGPNRWTRKYLDVWRQFIPEEQRHQFQTGGWYYVEVIRNQLAVFSLNTLYFFDSNSAVDGCAAKSEPGYEQFEWLRIQLQIMRERGMKAILTGHVPPARVDSKASWDETCWQKYALWIQQYKDVIVGSIYGHMNIDHFILQDFEDIKKHIQEGLVTPEIYKKGDGCTEFSVSNAGDYLVDLRDFFSKIPAVIGISQHTRSYDEGEKSWPDYLVSIFTNRKKHQKKKKGKSGLDKIGGEYAERYSLSFVSPSIVPNYFPTLRVFEYNITGLKPAAVTAATTHTTIQESQLTLPNDQHDSDFPSISNTGRENAQSMKKKQHKFIVPHPPSKSSPPGPAYSPQSLSLLGYTQYFANLTHINNDFVSKGSHDDVDSERWKEGHHHGKYKNGKPNPKEFKFQVEYDTFSDKVFGLKDLTVRSYVTLAKKIGMSKKGGKSAATEFEEAVEDDEEEEEEEINTDKKGGKKKKKKKHPKHHNKTWLSFVRRAFVGTMDLADIKNQYGHQQISHQETDPSLEL
jgi:endopolyphosphatase